MLNASIDPLLIKGSIHLLSTFERSTLKQKSLRLSKSPFFLCSTIFSIAFSPTPFIDPRPNKIVSSLREIKSLKLLFISGGSIFNPKEDASSIKTLILSVSSNSDDNAEAIN